MTTGNAVASTVSVAGVAMAAPTQTECEKLGDKNKEDRQKLKSSEDLSKSEQDAVAGPGSTITNYKFTPVSGKATTAAGTNRNESNSVDENHFKKGADEKTRKKKQSNLCVPYKYKGQGKRSSGHAESRIVEDTFGKNPGQPNPGILLVNVDLLKKGKDDLGRPKKSKMPCGHCHRLLCAAKKCGVVVFFCDKKDQPRELTDDMCEKRPSTPVRQSKRRKLKRVMGELPKGK